MRESKNKRRAIEEGPPKVPGYIVTYSDMVTLLLTFFVMLISLASVQDPVLFNRGRGAFAEAVRGFGLGMLFGRKPGSDFGSRKLMYYISNPDDLQGRTIDASEEEIRRAFKKVSGRMKTMPSQIVAQMSDFAVTNIQFSPGEATLDKSAKKFLTAFCADLQLSIHNFALSIYVLGLAGDQKADRDQWIVSAQRAQVVAEFLQDILRSGPGPDTRYGSPGFDTGRRVYWWGAGSGGEWVGPDSPISRNSQILIAVLKPGL
jgi:chemotaxis protein MotB